MANSHTRTHAHGNVSANGQQRVKEIKSAWVYIANLLVLLIHLRSIAAHWLETQISLRSKPICNSKASLVNISGLNHASPLFALIQSGNIKWRRVLWAHPAAFLPPPPCWVRTYVPKYLRWANTVERKVDCKLSRTTSRRLCELSGRQLILNRVELSLFCRSAESSQVCRAGAMRREAWHIFLLRACDAAVVWPSRAWNVDEVTGNYCDSYMLHATCCKVSGCCSSVSVLGFV